MPEPTGPSGRERLGDGFAQTAMTLVPCALVLSDDGGSVIVANPQADALFDVAPGGLRGTAAERPVPLGVGRGVGRAVEAAAPWRDAPFSSREALGVRPGGRRIRIRMSSGPVPLWLGTGVLVVAEPSTRCRGGAVERTVDLEEFLVRLDSVVRRIFSAGLTLTGLRERLPGTTISSPRGWPTPSVSWTRPWPKRAGRHCGRGQAD